MIRYLFVILILLSLCLPSFAFQLAELQTETAEELLLFFEVEEMVIATRHATPVRKAPAIATVITAKEIRDMGARDLRDVLKMVPGFGLSFNEFGTTMFEVRGIRTQTSEKILVMIDGHSLNKNFTGSALYDLVDDLSMEKVKRIEVIRGPGSALYGANAFAAVINIITRDPEEIDGLEVEGTFGSFDTRKINLTGGKSLDNGLKISGSFDHLTTDGPDITIKTDVLSGSPFTTAPGDVYMGSEKTDMFLKAAYNGLTFRGHYIKTEDKGHYIGLSYALTDDSRNPIDNYWAEITYDHDINSKLSSTYRLYYDYYEQRSDIELLPEGYAGQFPDGMIGRPWLKDRTVGGEVQINYDIDDSNHLIAGVMYEDMKQFDVHQYANFDPTMYPPVAIDLGSVQEVENWNQDAKREVWAVYIQDEWGVTDSLSLTAGVRHDNYSDFGGTTNPKIGAVWGFRENASLKILYGQAFRAPNFVEMYNRNNPVNIGNKDLDPEKISTFETGLGLRLAKSFSVDLTYFNSKVEDIIVWDTTSSPALHVNGGKADIEGMEFMLTDQYSTDDYWKLSYTWQDPRDGDTDEKLPYVPSHLASGIINYGLTKHLNLHTDILWTGERPRSSGDTRDDMAPYTTVDLAVTAKNFYKTLQIQGTIHNLLDERFKDPDTSGAQMLAPDDFPREGISGLLTVSYKF